MDKIFNIAFKINGELSGSFSSAIAAAQKQMQNLNRRISADTQRSMSRAARLGQDLTKLYAMKNAFDQYKKLNQGIQDNSAALVQARLKTAQLKQAYQEQYKTVEQMRQSYDRLRAVYRDNKNSMSADQRVAMQAQIRAAKDELKAQENVLSESKKRWQNSDSKSFKLGEQLSRQRAELASLQASLRSAGVSLSDMAAQEARLRAEIDRTTAALERQQRIDMSRARFNDAQQNLSNAASNFQDAMSTAGTIISPIKAAVDEAMTFEAAMSKVKALTQVKNIRAGDSTRVESEMAEMTAEIQKVAATSEFSQVEVAQMAQKYSMSGWQPKQILAALQPAINVATATGERDVVKIADMISDEMQALNLTAGGKVNVGGKTYDAMQHMADVFTYATNQSNVDANAFHEAMKYNAPIATSAGVNMHEIAALNMVMANSAIKGSMGGTAGRSGILRLVAPPKQAAKALEDLGMSASDAQKAVAEAGQAMAEMGIKDTDSVTTKIQKIQQALQGLGDQEKTAKLGKIFGTNGASGWAAIMAHYDDYIRYMKDFDSGAVEGWTDDTAAVMRDNTETQFKLLDSAVSALATTFGNLFLPALSQGVSMLTNFASGLQQWVQEHQELAKAAGLAAVAIAGIVVAVAGFGVAAASVQFLTSSFALLRTTLAGLSLANAASSVMSFGTSLMTAGRAAMALAFSPIGAVLMAIALAGYYCYTHWSQVAPVFESLASTLGGSLQGAISAISSSFESLGTSVSRLGPAFSQIGGAIFGALAVGLNAVVNIAATIISTFANAFAAVISLFGGLGNAIASALAGDWDKAAEHFKNAFINAGKFVVEAIKSLFGGIADTFTNFFKPLEIMGGFKGEKAASGGGSFGTPQPQQVDTQAIVSALSTAIESARKENSGADLSKIESAISTAVESIKQDPKTDITPQLQAISTAIESVKKENPEADTAKLEAVLQSAMQQIAAAQQAQQTQQAESFQANIEGLTVPLQAAGADMQTLQINSQGAGMELLNVQNGAQNFSTGLQTTQGQLSTFDGALQQPIGGLTNLGTAAGNAAGQVEQLSSGAGAVASALSAKAAEISSIHISAPTVSAAPVAANWKGGIYSKGAFLTTFAEKSPEAAIPIDKSQRAADLWTKTGQLLGLLPGNSTAIESTPQAQKVSTIERAQRQRLEQVKTQYEAAQKFSTPIEYDELGNIRGLDGLKENIITKEDDVQVARAKKSAQLAQWRKKNSTPTESLPKISLPNSTAIESPRREIPRSIFSGRVQTPEIFSTTQTQARNYETGLNVGDIIGAISGGGGGFLSEITQRISTESGGILPQMLNNLPQTESSSPIDLHFEINIAGNANAQEVEEGIRQTIPLIEETFEQKLANHQHEMQRRSF